MKYRGLDIDPSKIEETVTVKPNVLADSANAFKESTTPNGMSYLLPRIEAIHAGTTRNNTHYPADKLKGDPILKSGVYSWLHPFAKPVIYNHDVNTEATGRIQTAAFSELTSAGRPGIIVVPRITEPKAVKDVLEGRLLTVSIGATTDAAICSVCGTNIIEEDYCGHMKGEVYNGVKCEWIVGNVWFDELSWVNVPADSDAMIVSMGNAFGTAESFAYNGREVINLGRSTTEWLVAPETALAEGLAEQEQEGESTLTEDQIKAMEAELAELKTEKAELEEKLATAETAKTTAEETLAAKETELAEKATELTSVQEELEAKKTEIAELTSTKESLEAEKAALETSVQEETQSREQAVEESAKLATEIHKMTAERVVDLRISLGKESNREEAITAYAARSAESLKDSLEDLLKEAAVAPKETPTRQVEQVTNPVGGNVTETTTNEGPSIEDALKGLFGGPAFNRK